MEIGKGKEKEKKMGEECGGPRSHKLGRRLQSRHAEMQWMLHDLQRVSSRCSRDTHASSPSISD